MRHLGDTRPYGSSPWSGADAGPTSGTAQSAGTIASVAVGDLDARLRGEHADGPRRLDELRARFRLAYVTGAEEWTKDNLGRPLDTTELAAVLERFPT
jgi:hypothetical protein